MIALCRPQWIVDRRLPGVTLGKFSTLIMPVIFTTTPTPSVGNFSENFGAPRD
jgi:hypothetical protein